MKSPKSDSHAGSLSTKSPGLKHSNAMPLKKEDIADFD